MKILKRTLPVALASLLILNSAVPALAAETSSEAPSEKEEVIYITLDADGKLKNSYVVNCPLPAKIDRKKVKKTE